MGFFGSVFDDVKKVFSTSENVDQKSQHQKEQKGILRHASDAVIEKSLWGVRKYYDFKISTINKVSDIEPEWSFYDITQIEAMIGYFNKCIRELKEKIVALNKEIREYNSYVAENIRKTKVLQEEIRLLEASKNESQMALIKYKEKDIIEARKCKNGYEMVIEGKKNDIERFQKQIQELYESKIRFLSLKGDYGSLVLCKQDATQAEIDTPYVIYGIDSLMHHVKGEFVEAYKCALDFIEAEKIGNNGVVAIHPILADYLAKYYFSVKNFSYAEKNIAVSIGFYPENVDYHKTMYEIQLKMGNNKKANLEHDIIELLS